VVNVHTVKDVSSVACLKMPLKRETHTHTHTQIHVFEVHTEMITFFKNVHILHFGSCFKVCVLYK